MWIAASRFVAIVAIGLFGFGSAADALVACSAVPSREFSDDFDRNPDGSANPGNVLFFSCGGGIPAFGGPPTNSPKDFNPGQVDSLARDNDRFFPEARDNQVPLLISVEDDPNIYFEKPSGERNVWVFDAAEEDLDGLEIWGDSLVTDYSLQGDPGGISLFSTSTTFPITITQTQILNAIQGLGIGLNLSAASIDVDATMRHATLNQLMFSVAPIQDLGGGEIFVLNLVSGAAIYLNHGGHLWDTNFNVIAAFNVVNENVNAIEAVPEPATAVLLGFGLLAVMACCRRV